MRNLRVTFWGVQGSCPTCPSSAELEEIARQAAMRIANERTQSESPSAPAPFPPFYGGDTSCVEVETADGEIILFDLGTGVRACSHHLLGRIADKTDRTVHVFGSHQHIDHRMGTSFASFCFARPNPFSVHVYGNHEFLQSLEERYGLFSHHVTSSMHRDDPIDVDMMSADFQGVQLVPGNKSEPVGRANLPGVRTHFGPVRIGSAQVTPFEVYHGPTPCLGYKLTRNGASFVYCTDHEQRHGDASDP
ncbi:MAG TPA: MBL fold metallo-hydrolase, partial [Tepidisphaeraceae bacterium]|nr:MBL fold metallo-hydrolase [Tepidisphaeraceae bacterium]